MKIGICSSVLIAFVSFLGYFLVSNYINLGFSNHVYEHFPGPCRLIPGVKDGAEDIEVLPNGIAFISPGLKLTMTHDIVWHRKEVKSKIYRFDFNHPEKNAQVIAFDPKFDAESYSGHGISLWQTPSGDVLLYAVNHHPKGDRVEKFRYDSEKNMLVHLDSFMDPSIILLNDVTVVGEDEFYASNFFYLKGYLRIIETFFLSWGNVIHFKKGAGSKIVVSGVSFPNGIQLSRDKKFVYLAVLSEGAVRVFERQPNGNLRHANTIHVHIAVDNIFVDLHGHLWIAAGPIFYKAILHMDDPRNPAPSRALRVEMLNQTHPAVISEVLQHNGTLISLASVAAFHEGAMLVGSVMHNLMYCTLTAF